MWEGERRRGHGLCDVHWRGGDLGSQQNKAGMGNISHLWGTTFEETCSKILHLALSDKERRRRQSVHVKTVKMRPPRNNRRLPFSGVLYSNGREHGALGCKWYYATMTQIFNNTPQTLQHNMATKWKNINFNMKESWHSCRFWTFGKIAFTSLCSMLTSQRYIRVFQPKTPPAACLRK